MFKSFELLFLKIGSMSLMQKLLGKLFLGGLYFYRKIIIDKKLIFFRVQLHIKTISLRKDSNYFTTQHKER